MKDAAAPTIRRQDYRPPDYRVEDIALTFRLDPERTVVVGRLVIRRTAASARADAPLILHGRDLETLAIAIDGRPVEASPSDDETLEIKGAPEHFTLTTEVAIRPEANTALEGLYRSGPFLLTQCEPEGFRKITWMLDRPDVLARYRVRLEADRAQFPVLLSNGNRVEAGALADGRHFTVWEDPFPKPSYLFALVAGDLACLEDHFDTQDGRRVALKIYAERENIARLGHAMDSLKHAMAWDERRFGLAYDLDVYHIVATNDFNMGAMENKGLNIFNAKYVLAAPETATDQDYQAIEGVIGHEYFHNWTGNRVTCRDWFQLSLKEGLTVFRDQEFSSDRQSRAVKRIEDVRLLRAHQFAEDAGPMAHPVRPERYQEINNFYTLTVYEKGAEVVRMYHTLLGEEGFQRGMRRYVARHDGQAVTCEDFLAAMAEANDVDLDQFGRWYAQAGTPEITATDAYDAATGRYTLTFRQRTPDTVGSDERRPLHIPIAIGLLGPDGEDLPLRSPDTRLGGDGDVLELREAEASFVFEGLAARPIPSLLRRFSAPVKLRYGYDRDQLAFLAGHDADPFNRWDAAQRLATEVILEQVAGAGHGPIDERLLAAMAAQITDRDADPALIAEALALPELEYLWQQADEVDVGALHRARRRVEEAIARSHGAAIEARLAELPVETPYRPEPSAIARRALRRVLLAYATIARPEALAAELVERYEQADNMTDRMTALRLLVHEQLAPAVDALRDFRERFRDDPLTLDKWFAVQATVPSPDALCRVRVLLDDPAFAWRNPNKVRALVGAFARNLVAFHAPDGEGYRFVADQVLTLDRLNPQIAARLVSVFNPWRRLAGGTRRLARGELERIAREPSLSPDVSEIVGKALAPGPAVGAAAAASRPEEDQGEPSSPATGKP